MAESKDWPCAVGKWMIKVTEKNPDTGKPQITGKRLASILGKKESQITAIKQGGQSGCDLVKDIHLKFNVSLEELVLGETAQKNGHLAQVLGLLHANYPFVATLRRHALEDLKRGRTQLQAATRMAKILNAIIYDLEIDTPRRKSKPDLSLIEKD